MKNEKRFIKRKIISQKFFAPEKLPPMLTYNERMCIKYLHNVDPIQWDVETLSESFPATPFVIKKVLKSKWEGMPAKAKEMDLRVQKNWKLLSEGKLEANPEAIRHFKKFLNRKEVLLEQIQNTNFYLPEVKKETKQYCGEMSNILKDYEKKVDELIDFSNKQQLPSGAQSENSPPVNENTKIKDINFSSGKVNNFDKNSETESYLLRKVISRFSEQVTLENNNEDFVNKHKENIELNLVEKLREKTNSSRLEVIHDENLTKERDKTDEREYTKHNLENQTPRHKSFIPKSYKQVAQQISNRFSNVNIKNSDYDIENWTDAGKYQIPGKNTLAISELNIAKSLSKETIPSEKLVTKDRVEDFNERLQADTTWRHKHEEYYNREVESIKHTPFWNDKKNSKGKELLEFQKVLPSAPKNIMKVTKADLFSSDKYPQRIKIPPSERGSGKTFKVKDCYYDDDGKFLYRVPGMLN